MHISNCRLEELARELEQGKRALEREWSQSFKEFWNQEWNQESYQNGQSGLGVEQLRKIELAEELIVVCRELLRLRRLIYETAVADLPL